MKITALEEYGLRCILRLGLEPEGASLTVAEIASSEGMTAPYVGKLMSILRQSGIVESVRGRGGGYRLSRPAGEISVHEVLGALGEPLFSNEYCESHGGALDVCAHQGDCSIRSVWQVLGDVIERVLGRTSIADLCLEEAQLARRLEVCAQPVLVAIAGASAPDGAGAAGLPAKASRSTHPDMTDVENPR